MTNETTKTDAPAIAHLLMTMVKDLSREDAEDAINYILDNYLKVIDWEEYFLIGYHDDQDNVYCARVGGCASSGTPAIDDFINGKYDSDFMRSRLRVYKTTDGLANWAVAFVRPDIDRIF